MPSRRRLSVLLLVSTLPVMTGAVLSPALPALRSAFGGGAAASLGEVVFRATGWFGQIFK